MSLRLTYADALEFLYGLRLFGAKLGLENTFKLATLAGSPQKGLRFIHVAGTNGKGSTCAMLESIYRASGRRVGLFTSPHLVSFRERIQVDRRMIPADDVIRLVAMAQEWLGEFQGLPHPTFFEVVAVLALRYFAEQACDVVIWETGLGGRLDATNIVTPLASVITNIQLDHEKWLGSTVAQIATEKAGIIKPGVPVFTAAELPDALAVIRATAEHHRAPLRIVTSTDTAQPPLDKIELPLIGEHQRLNAALAQAVARSLQGQLPLSDSALQTGLETVQWPGRLQQYRAPGGQLVLLDGAHNPAGAESLRDALQTHFSGRPPTLILGVFQDKDWTAICRILTPLARRIFVVPVHSERATPPLDLERACAELGLPVEITKCSSLTEALERSKRDEFVLITGSLHLVGEAMEELHLLPGAGDERTLNEWHGAGVGQGSPKMGGQ